MSDLLEALVVAITTLDKDVRLIHSVIGDEGGYFTSQYTFDELKHYKARADLKQKAANTLWDMLPPDEQEKYPRP